MPYLPIPFTSVNRSADKPALNTFNQNQIDGYWQEYVSPDGVKLIWAKRPGMSLFCDTGRVDPIDGLHYWIRQQKLMAVCGSKIFRIDSLGSETDVTGTSTMTSRVRPTFADVAGTNLYIAGGQKINEVPYNSTGAFLADAQAPTAVRFVGTINQVLVALNDASSRLDWANAGTPTVWDGLYATAEAEPDLTQAFLVANNYLHFWGQNTLEVWRDDGETFVRESQGAIGRGTAARYSVTNINGSFYWLGNDREVIRLNGFTPEIISNPALSRYINSFSTVSDARGDYIRIEGRHFYVLSFPVEEKTLVFDIGLSQWYEWSYFHPTRAEHGAWLGSCAADATENWNKVLVGDRRTGKIWTLTGTTDDGADIRTVIRTDHTDRQNPDTWKFCHALDLIFKRSDTNATPKQMLIRWRDDGKTDWTAYRECEIESHSHTELLVRVRHLGRYKRRQWEFVMSDATQAALLSAMERFDIGR